MCVEWRSLRAGGHLALDNGNPAVALLATDEDARWGRVCQSDLLYRSADEVRGGNGDGGLALIGV
jgi:hypothetical protein